jgi:hypothetical protein
VADVLYQLKVLRQIRIDTLAQAMNNFGTGKVS